MTRLLAAVVVLLCLAARPTGMYVGDDDPPPVPPAAREVDIDEKLGARVDRTLAFTDHDGRSVRLGDYLGDGKPLILVLAYFRCPMLCGLVLKGVVDGLADLDWKLGRDYRALTISFDPRDGYEAAAQKRASTLAALGATEGWPFLVGREAEVRALADELGFRYAYDPRTDQYAHPVAAFVLTPDGRISRYLYGVRFAPRDLRLALVEAGEGRTGGIVDRVVMTCYRYDPASRTYAPYVIGFMRLGGGAILVSVGGVLAALWLAERRRRIRTAPAAGRRQEASS